MTRKHIKTAKTKHNFVGLTDYEKEPVAIDRIVAALMFESYHSSFESLLAQVKKMSNAKKTQIIKDFATIRKNRRQRPPRAFEMTQYTFDISGNFGMFRDLHRHRVLTLERQLLTADHGFSVPKEITDLGIEKDFRDCMKFELMRSRLPEQAQYVVNFAYNYPFIIRLNLREACHLIELRTVPQGHADYRKVAQQMFLSIKKAHPNLSKIIKFADMHSYELERFESEKRTEEKRKSIKPE